MADQRPQQMLGLFPRQEGECSQLDATLSRQEQECNYLEEALSREVESRKVAGAKVHSLVLAERDKNTGWRWRKHAWGLPAKPAPAPPPPSLSREQDHKYKDEVAFWRMRCDGLMAKAFSGTGDTSSAPPTGDQSADTRALG